MKLIIYTFISLFVIHAHASEKHGGGNIINGKAIEEYLINPYELPFFENSLEDFVGKFRGILPTLADAIDKTVTERNWYLMPIQLTQLPFEVTELNFYSDQVAYQNDSEIFLDHNLMNMMSEKSLGLLYRHEVFMATLKLSSVKTRTLMSYSAKTPLFSITEFRDKVAQLSGTVYLTHLEIVLVESIVDQINADMMKICNRFNEEKVINEEFEKFFSHNFTREPGWYMNSKQKALDLLEAEYVEDIGEIYSKSIRDNISARLSEEIPGINLATYLYKPHTPFMNYCKSHTN